MEKFEYDLEKAEITKGMFRDFEFHDDGISYLFDGYIECVVYIVDGKFYDVQDTNVDKMLFLTNYKEFNSFDSLEELKDNIIKTHTEFCN